MSASEAIIVHVCAAIVIAAMFAVCLRSKAPATTAELPRHFYVHGAWYGFSAASGVFLVGLFAFASTTADPADRTGALACSVASALGFILFALFLRSLAVTVDEHQLTSRVLWKSQSVALDAIERVAVVGLVVEVKLKPEASSGQRAGALTFLPVFRGLGELLETLRHQSKSRAQPR